MMAAPVDLNVSVFFLSNSWITFRILRRCAEMRQNMGWHFEILMRKWIVEGRILMCMLNKIHKNEMFWPFKIFAFAMHGKHCNVFHWIHMPYFYNCCKWFILPCVLLCVIKPVWPWYYDWVTAPIILSCLDWDIKPDDFSGWVNIGNFHDP